MRTHAWLLLVSALTLVGLTACGSAGDGAPAQSQPAFVPRDVTLAYDPAEDFINAEFQTVVTGEVLAEATIAHRVPGAATFVAMTSAGPDDSAQSVTFGIGTTCRDDPRGTEYRLEVRWCDAAGNPSWMQQATATKP